MRQRNLVLYTLRHRYPMTNSDIVQKLWNLCDVLRDDGINYSDYWPYQTRHTANPSIKRITRCLPRLPGRLGQKLISKSASRPSQRSA